MDDKTLDALQRSIAKWERNAKAKTPEEYLISADDCPLCELFFDGGCAGCPVEERAGFGCMGSPYDDAYVAHFRWRKGKGGPLAARKAAEAEVAFLRSLLPEESK